MSPPKKNVELIQELTRKSKKMIHYLHDKGCHIKFEAYLARINYIKFLEKRIEQLEKPSD